MGAQRSASSASVGTATAILGSATATAALSTIAPRSRSRVMEPPYLGGRRGSTKAGRIHGVTTDREHARNLLASASRIAVLSGAGISTESGIPDFRGPNGLWTKNPAAERLFTLRDYVADPDIRRDAWPIRREHA